MNIDDEESFDATDPLDVAGRVERMEREYNISKARRNKPEQEQNPDGSWPVTECVECEVELPQLRIEMGRVRCVDCQTLKEKTGR